jgi:ribosomal protein S18 acetylase RimI-like enzyme
MVVIVAQIAPVALSDVDALDNPVWHSIDGPRRALAHVVGCAGTYDRDVAPFGAVCDDPPASAWDDLGELVPPGRGTATFTTSREFPEGWSDEHRIPCLQMIATTATTGAHDDRFIELGPQDVPEMLELVALTQPGPFGKRTIEFGGYIGYREDGRLVAMAGERMSVRGFTEISAVCTAPDFQGRGLAAALVLSLVESIRARDEDAFLHVMTTNNGAIRVYERVGFETRCEIDAVILRRGA